MDDAFRVRELAGDWEVAKTTGTIPHPYEAGVAETWISGHGEAFAEQRGVVFAIDLQSDGLLIGAVGLELHMTHEWAELGYWIGKPYWNRGYGTEAAREVLRYGFQELRLNRIHARYMPKNVASGRIMEKLGMRREGTLRQSLKRFGTFEDMIMYSILRQEYKTGRGSGGTG